MEEEEVKGSEDSQAKPLPTQDECLKLLKEAVKETLEKDGAKRVLLTKVSICFYEKSGLNNEEFAKIFGKKKGFKKLIQSQPDDYELFEENGDEVSIKTPPKKIKIVSSENAKDAKKPEPSKITKKPETKEKIRDKSDIEKFAYFNGGLNSVLDILAGRAERESWGKGNWILSWYIKEYFEIIYKEKERYIYEAEDERGKFICFNTGLLTSLCDEIYALFRKNKGNLVFIEWVSEGDQRLVAFDNLPPCYMFLKTKEDVVFNTDLKITSSNEHILEEHADRFPKYFKEMDNLLKSSMLKGFIGNIKKIVARNPRIAVPQFYQKELGFFLPMYFSEKESPLALAVTKKENKYHIATCLPLDWAYRYARIVGKVESSWLKLGDGNN